MPELLALSQINTVSGCQPRAGVSSEVVDDYAALLLSGTKLPPVVVFHDGAEHYLADGYHRFEAHKKIKRSKIPVEIRQGTLRDAILFSLGANQDHGLRRTMGERRRAVEKMLRDEEWGRWSDSRIAEHVGVSQPYVSAIAREIEPELKHRLKSERVTKTGRTINTANIGRKPAAPKTGSIARTSEHAQEAPDDGLPVRDDAADFDPDTGEVFEGDQPEPEFEREAGGNAEVLGEQQACTLEQSSVAATPAPESAVPVQWAPHAADDREGGESDRHPQAGADPAIHATDETERARDYLAELLKGWFPGIAIAPDLMGVCTQIDHMIADLQLKARYPEERRADGTVAFHINPDDEQSRLENGMAIAMPPTRNRDPADAAIAYSRPLYSDDLSRFVEWMIDFEARFRSIHGTGNEAALASEAAA